MNRPVTSASNLFRRFLCPGSERMEEGLPPDTSHQALEGSLLHDYSDHREFDRSVLKPEQQDLLRINDELIAKIERRLDAFGLGRNNEFGAILTGDTYFDNGLISGTPDFVVANRNLQTVWVNDVKYGYKIVERADLNLQLRAYALLVYDYLEGKVKSLFVSITQPRVREDERITLAEYKPEDMPKVHAQISQILERAQKDRAKLVASEEACRYCRARLICPEFRRAFGELAILDKTPDWASWSLAKKEQESLKILAGCSDEQLEKILIGLAFATMIGPLARDEARKRVEAGGLTNYELSKPHQKREITDTKRAVTLLALARVEDRDRLFGACSLSLRAVEEMYRKRTGCTAPDARRKIADVLRDIIEVTLEKPRLLRKNDR